MVNQESLDSALEAYVTQLQSEINAFRKSFSISIIISISGGAEEHNHAYAETAITQLIKGLKPLSFAVLTGGTEGGIPELGTKIATSLEIPTIGVFPPKAHKYALLNDLDLAIQTLPPSIGSPGFGTETPSFAQLPDYAVVIGGSYGTLAEVSTILKGNTKRIKDGKNPIYLCPLAGSGGVAELIPTLVELSPNLLSCLPLQTLTTGAAIARFIIETEAKKQD